MAYIKQSNILTNVKALCLKLTRDTPHLLSRPGEEGQQLFPFLPNHILKFSSSTKKGVGPLAVSRVSPNATFPFLQPHSQGLSSLRPLVVATETLAAAA